MTVAKEVAISGDGGSTYFTLPGGTGEWNDEGEQITDTIFGHTFSSTQPGLITWTANANALYKGFAGYVARLMSSGPSTAMTAEAMTLVSGKTYKVDSNARSVWDWTKSLVVDDAGSPIDVANIEEINYLFGTVTFVDSFTPGGAVTVDGFYLPLTEIAKGSSFTLTQTAETLDKTDFPTARANDGYRVFDAGLRTVALEIGGFYESSSAFWETLEAREDIVIEINPDGSGLSLARGIFKLVSRTQSGDVGALEEETRTFNLSVPENLPIIFNWEHDNDTTLSQAIQIALQSWLDQTKIRVKYLPDGDEDTTFEGDAVLTDLSLSSSLDAMNEFTVSLQGSDQPVRTEFGS